MMADTQLPINDELQATAALGVSRVLGSTALHRGWITIKHLQTWHLNH